MGKNFQGGKKAKSMARKTAGGYGNDAPTPMSSEQEFSLVKQVSGNGRFRVVNSTGFQYVAVLPGAMRGRKKRNNYVAQNTYLLINNRTSWQTMKPLAHVDVDFVYSEQQAKQLRLHDMFKSQINTIFGPQNPEESSVQFSSGNHDFQEETPPTRHVVDDEEQDEDVNRVLEHGLDLDLI